MNDLAFRRSNPRLGDLMNELFPLLSIYTPYIEHFNNAMTSMTLWTEKCPIFNRLVMEVEVRSQISSKFHLKFANITLKQFSRSIAKISSE